MIDAAWVLGGGDIAGDTAQSDYTTAAWETGVGNGLNVTPAGGNTTKKLIFPNAGLRNSDSSRSYHGINGYVWSTDQSSASNAWYLRFYNSEPAGRINSLTKLYARPLRCVRS